MRDTRELVRAWKNRKIAEGWCAHCFRRQAGFTKRLCEPCATRHKDNYYRRIHGLTGNVENLTR